LRGLILIQQNDIALGRYLLFVQKQTNIILPSKTNKPTQALLQIFFSLE
jgi:hypothetical protein